MIKDVEIFVAALMFFLSVLLIFNARVIVKRKLKSKNENISVNIIKGLGYSLCLVSLFIMYYVK